MHSDDGNRLTFWIVEL